MSGRLSRISTVAAVIASSLAIAVVLPNSVVKAAGPANTKVALGETHALAVATNGTAWTWGSLVPGPDGSGSRYSLSQPTQVTIPGSRSVEDVATTRQSSAVLASDGTVWAWGYLGMGLGDVSSTTSSSYLSPLQVSFGGKSISAISGDCEGYIAVDVDGDVWQWGSFWGVWSLSSSSPIKVVGVTNAVSVAKSCSSAYAVLADGTIKAWGSNGGGKLGDGTTYDRQTPVAVSLPSRSVRSLKVSDSHVLALATDNTVWGWGSNAYSQLAADPNAVQFSDTPRNIAVAGALGTVVAIGAANSTPSSYAVMSSGEVWEWGNWSPTAFAPRKRNIPTTELGTTKLTSVVAYYSNLLFTGSDNSIWARGSYSQYGSSIDGNCGADATDYQQWINGRMVPARFLVRTLSQGQFGSTFSEDKLAVRSIATSTGTNLPLDNSGTATSRQGNSLSIVTTAPSSLCYAASSLSVTWDFNGDGTFETTGIASVNDVGTPISTGSYTFDWSGRRRGSVKIENPLGVSQTYSFWLGISASASGGGDTGVVSALPRAAKSGGVTVAIGTDGYLYGWGKASAVIGTESIIPRRLFADSTTKYSDIKLFVTRSISVAAAKTTSGQVHVWGKSEVHKLFFTNDNSPVTETSQKYQIPMPNVDVTRWQDVMIATCEQRPLVMLIGDDQQAYVHGIAPQSATNRYSSSNSCVSSSTSKPEAPLSLAGMQFSAFGPRGSSGWWGAYFSLKGTTTAEPWRVWTLMQGATGDYSCDGHVCGYLHRAFPVMDYEAGNRLLGTFDVPYSRPDCTYPGYSASSLQISSSGQVERVVKEWNGGSCSTNPRTRGVLIDKSRTALTSWTTRTAVAIHGETIIASDGTVWEVSYWASEPLRRKNLDDRMASVSRFAGDSDYLVTSDSALWSLSGDRWDPTFTGSQFGNCGTRWSNDEGAGIRVFSNGQFGGTSQTPFSEDRFGFQVDAAAVIANEQFPDQGYMARENDWGSATPAIKLRPSSSAQLFGYVTSSCELGNISSVQWDMDDNGVYETSGTISAVESGATPMATPRVNRFNEVTYGGFGSDWRQVKTPAMDLSVPGGRYVGVKITSSFGYQTKRFAVLVQPRKPPGYTGVTINSGARFTDSSDVILTLNWPENSTTALISNDGGFEDAQEVPLSRTVPWKLPSMGTGQLGSSVYVRYLALEPDQAGSWTQSEVGYQLIDDIVLDLSAPTVSNVAAATGSSVALAMSSLTGRALNTTTQFATVSIAAFDQASGIAGMQVASDPAIPGPVLPYSSQIRIPVDRERVAVRVQDNVGLWSSWKYARVSGYVVQPETPRPVTPVQPFVPGAPAVAPVAPSGPVTSVTGGAAVPIQVPTVEVPKASTNTPSVSTEVAKPVLASSAVAVLKGKIATVVVKVPTSLAKTCKTKVVKKKKTTTCVPAPIVVSVSGGKSITLKAKAGSNSVKIPGKKGSTVTVKVGGKVVQRIKLK